jgi:hypothetical protein
MNKYPQFDEHEAYDRASFSKFAPQNHTLYKIGRVLDVVAYDQSIHIASA